MKALERIRFALVGAALALFVGGLLGVPDAYAFVEASSGFWLTLALVLFLEGVKP